MSADAAGDACGGCVVVVVVVCGSSGLSVRERHSRQGNSGLDMPVSGCFSGDSDLH